MVVPDFTLRELGGGITLLENGGGFAVREIGGAGGDGGGRLVRGGGVKRGPLKPPDRSPPCRVTLGGGTPARKMGRGQTWFACHTKIFYLNLFFCCENHNPSRYQTPTSIIRTYRPSHPAGKKYNYHHFSIFSIGCIRGKCSVNTHTQKISPCLCSQFPKGPIQHHASLRDAITS